MICAFTGHRPERLPWGKDESDARCLALKTLLLQTVQEVYGRGYRTFLCGMARGCDLYFAEAVLAAKRSGSAPEARLCALIPCPSQPDGWDAATQSRYRGLLAACDRVEVLEGEYSPGCMLRRNREMIRRAALLISVYDGGDGGTAAAIRFAQATGVAIWPIWM